MDVFASDNVAEKGISPSGILITDDGRMIMTDLYSKAIFQGGIGQQGVRITGETQIYDVAGEAIGGYRDGTLKQALFLSPWSAAPYQNAFGQEGYAVTDTDNHALRFVTTSQVSTLAGGKKQESTVFNRPTGLAADGSGNLYIADSGNHRICKIENGQVITIAETQTTDPDDLYQGGYSDEPDTRCVGSDLLK